MILTLTPALAVAIISLKFYQNILMTELPSPRTQLKHQIDRMLLHDFQTLRSRPADLADLLTFTQNQVMMQYIKQIYNQYNLPNPLLQFNLSCLSSSPSGAKTIKKPKINLMSSQTLKYSLTPRMFYQDHQDPIDYSTYEHDHSSRLCFYHNTTHSSLGHLYREAKEQQLNKTSLIDLNYHYQNGRRVHVCDSEYSQRCDMMIEVQEKVEINDTVDNQGYVLPCSSEEDRSSACSSQCPSPNSNSCERPQSNECRTPQKPAGFSNSLANSAKTRAFSPQFNNTKLYFGQSSFMDSEYSEGQ